MGNRRYTEGSSYIFLCGTASSIYLCCHLLHQVPSCSEPFSYCLKLVLKPPQDPGLQYWETQKTHLHTNVWENKNLNTLKYFKSKHSCLDVASQVTETITLFICESLWKYFILKLVFERKCLSCISSKAVLPNLVKKPKFGCF